VLQLMDTECRFEKIHSTTSELRILNSRLLSFKEVNIGEQFQGNLYDEMLTVEK
jgi:hypothetical protein